jgi:cytochrome oxidase Cu insertion factor (SCO1/SenC/PrrC family)
MILHKKSILFVLLFTLLLAACAPVADESDAMLEDKPTEAMMEDETSTPDAMLEDKPTEAMMEKTDDSMMEDKTATPDSMVEDSSMVKTPVFFSALLTDVTSGETFSINDLKGKVVLVETMAQWCPKCLQQQQQVLELHQLLGERDDFVSLGLDVDPNEDAATLKSYIESNSFSWTYAVSPAEVSSEIANLYGNQFLNPSSTPMFIIDRKGEVHLLPFGIKSAQDLLDALQPYLDEGM